MIWLITFRVLALVPICFSAQAQYEFVLKGGHVIDPKNGIDRQMDVAVAAGKIAAVAPAIDASQTKNLIDVHGLYVTPGLVDIHTHLFFATNLPNAWAGDESVQPDAFSFRTGVTTMADAGSAGWRRCIAARRFRRGLCRSVKPSSRYRRYTSFFPTFQPSRFSSTRIFR